MLSTSGIAPLPGGLTPDPTAANVFVIIGIVALVASIAYGVHVTRRDRNPLYFLVMLGSLTIFPFYIEPIGDVLGATYYPPGQPIAATIVGHPIPWFVVLIYGAGIPLSLSLVQSLIERGAPAKHLLIFTAAACAWEIPFEMTLGHFQLMHYYSNNALVLGLPFSSIVQNGGLFVIMAFGVLVLRPHLHGWRWLAIPWFVPSCFGAWAVVTTIPSYIAINSGWSPAIAWPMALISTGLNLAVLLAAIYSPTLQRLRVDTGEVREETPPLAVAVG